MTDAIKVGDWVVDDTELAALRAAHAALGELVEAVKRAKSHGSLAVWEANKPMLKDAIDKARAAYRAAGGETCDS